MENKLYQGVVSYCCHAPVEMLGVSKGFCCSKCKQELFSWVDEKVKTI